MKRQPSTSDYTIMYHPNGTCCLSVCGKHGMILAYDKRFPDIGLWFCQECWKAFSELPFLIKVQDTRQQEEVQG